MRLASEIARRGALDVLRNGIKDIGCKFRMARFRPASGLNEETRRLYEANLFSVVRQLRYSEKNENSLDLALFLNGVPIFTAELKNPSHRPGRARRHAPVQDRPRSARAAARRRTLSGALCRRSRSGLRDHPPCRTPYALSSFQPAESSAEPATRPCRPRATAIPTSYLWDETWAPRQRPRPRPPVHPRRLARKTTRATGAGKRLLIFPRYQQLDCVRRLVADAREQGTGRRYLIQHSAGSGKTFTIAWLAHQLSTLHDADESRVFDSIVVITDRRILDRQLQAAMRQFEQTLGVVENIDKTSRQLKAALESGKTIIVTTLQKFPVIAARDWRSAGPAVSL